MASPYQMRTIQTTLQPSVKKKPIKATQGKVLPVTKKPPPLRAPTPKKPSPIKPLNSTSVGVGSTSNMLGAQAQQKAIESKAPVSTQLNVSYEADPVLARIKALGAQDVANARSEAEALRKKAIIDSGLSDVGAEIGLDPGTVQAAAANPFSSSALLRKEQATRGHDLDESLNQQNLFYGGHRATQLAELASSGAQQQAALSGDIRSLLGGINSGVTQAEQAAALANEQALQDAAESARLEALQQSYIDALNQPDLSVVQGLGLPPDRGPLPMDQNSYYYNPYEEDILAALGIGGMPGASLGYY